MYIFSIQLIRTVNAIKFQTFFLFFSNKMLVIRARVHKMIVIITNREDLCCLSRPLWQANDVSNFEISKVW